VTFKASAHHLSFNQLDAWVKLSGAHRAKQRGERTRSLSRSRRLEPRRPAKRFQTARIRCCATRSIRNVRGEGKTFMDTTTLLIILLIILVLGGGFYGRGRWY
jgi:hypothetical protein